MVGMLEFAAMSVHKSAIIGKNVTLGKDNEIGPQVVIEDGVHLGAGNKIGARAYLCVGTELGDQNEVHMGAVIGNTPQDLAFKAGTPSYTKIGSGNVIREYVTIHRGTKEETATRLGNQNFLMAYTHVAHNCEIGNSVIMVNNATLGGYCVVEDSAFISSMVVVHQFVRVGRLTMVSGMSAINLDVPPYMTCGGRPGVVHAWNAVGVRRAGFSPAVRDEIKRAYKILYVSDLKRADALVEIEQTCSSAELKHFVEFIKTSKRGISNGRQSRKEEAMRF
jgi:UDP-N-acetylglucosamine acyltransferase